MLILSHPDKSSGHKSAKTHNADASTHSQTVSHVWIVMTRALRASVRSRVHSCVVVTLSLRSGEPPLLIATGRPLSGPTLIHGVIGI